MMSSLGMADAGDVPYIICLDRPSRSLVLSIRGTQSLADAATDLLAYPHPLQDWLPPSSHQVSSSIIHCTCAPLSARHPW